jgi:DNA polymerase
LLRLPDEDRRAEEQARFVADLAMIGDRLRVLTAD